MDQRSLQFEHNRFTYTATKPTYIVGYLPEGVKKPLGDINVIELNRCSAHPTRATARRARRACTAKRYQHVVVRVAFNRNTAKWQGEVIH